MNAMDPIGTNLDAARAKARDLAQNAALVAHYSAKHGPTDVERLTAVITAERERHTNTGPREQVFNVRCTCGHIGQTVSTPGEFERHVDSHVARAVLGHLASDPTPAPTPTQSETPVPVLDVNAADYEAEAQRYAAAVERWSATLTPSCTCYAFFLADNMPTKGCPIDDPDGTRGLTISQLQAAGLSQPLDHHVCTCATDGDAHRCPFHTQADYDAQDARRTDHAEVE